MQRIKARQGDRRAEVWQSYSFSLWVRGILQDSSVTSWVWPGFLFWTRTVRSIGGRGRNADGEDGLQSLEQMSNVFIKMQQQRDARGCGSCRGNLTKFWLAVWEEDAEDIVSGLVLLLIWDRVDGSRSLRHPLPQLGKHLSLPWEYDCYWTNGNNKTSAGIRPRPSSPCELKWWASAWLGLLIEAEHAWVVFIIQFSYKYAIQ